MGPDSRVQYPHAGAGFFILHKKKQKTQTTGCSTPYPELWTHPYPELWTHPYHELWIRPYPELWSPLPYLGVCRHSLGRVYTLPQCDVSC